MSTITIRDTFKQRIQSFHQFSEEEFNSFLKNPNRNPLNIVFIGDDVLSYQNVLKTAILVNGYFRKNPELNKFFFIHDIKAVFNDLFEVSISEFVLAFEISGFNIIYPMVGIYSSDFYNLKQLYKKGRILS
jgi:hypothetical protein